MSVKKRNWAFLGYPESLPENWRELLQQTGLQCAISPLHDCDIDPTGVPKKPHYHVIVCYSGPTSFNVVKALTDSLHQPIPQALEQVRGYYRYLTHKDNPEKAQYNECDISSINGFNIADFVDLTRSELLHIKQSIFSLIQKEDILEYSDLIDFLLSGEMMVELDVASSNTLLFDRYVSSRRNKRTLRKSELVCCIAAAAGPPSGGSHAAQNVVDTITGDVI